MSDDNLADMPSLHDKVALVTGASRGIGNAIARQLAQDGAVVIGTATHADGAEAFEKSMQEEGWNASGQILDVSNAESVTQLMQILEEKKWLPDILVNNAGIVRDGLLLRMADEQWQQVIATNLNGVFYLTRACLRNMLRKRAGRIITISSVAGLTGSAGQCNYSAAKAGVIGFTRSLALEVAARGITVNAIAPGFIATDMTAKLQHRQEDEVVQQIPLKRFGTAAEVAKVVAFFASEQAAYITGEVINVSGGLYM